jgi:hypothetical protein
MNDLLGVEGRSTLPQEKQRTGIIMVDGRCLVVEENEILKVRCRVLLVGAFLTNHLSRCWKTRSHLNLGSGPFASLGRHSSRGRVVYIRRYIVPKEDGDILSRVIKSFIAAQRRKLRWQRTGPQQIDSTRLEPHVIAKEIG